MLLSVPYLGVVFSIQPITMGHAWGRAPLTCYFTLEVAEHHLALPKLCFMPC